MQFQSPSQSLEPPQVNQASEVDEFHSKNFDDNALPSVKLDDTTKSTHAKTGKEVAETHESGGHVGGYQLATIDFGRVETPFIIGVWILFASIAKIGELNKRAFYDRRINLNLINSEFK